MSRKPKPITERLWARTSIDMQSGCWVWNGARFKDTGYGMITCGGRNRTVHSVAFELFIGDVAEGKNIDHVAERGCIHRACWNPAHLEAVTPRENVLRGSGPSAANARKTHCPKGHEYSQENTRLSKAGSRFCRACARDRAAAGLRERRRAEGRSVAVPCKDKTHCKHGHEFTEENTRVAGGKRLCRACGRERARRHRQRGV